MYTSTAYISCVSDPGSWEGSVNTVTRVTTHTPLFNTSGVTITQLTNAGHHGSTQYFLPKEMCFQGDITLAQKAQQVLTEMQDAIQHTFAPFKSGAASNSDGIQTLNAKINSGAGANIDGNDTLNDEINSGPGANVVVIQSLLASCNVGVATNGAGIQSVFAHIKTQADVNLDDISLLILIVEMNRQTSAGLLDQEQVTIKLNSQAAQEATQARVKKIQEQSDQAIENQKKAQKAGIFNVVLEFLSSALQVVSGIVKLMSGNPTGALDLAAGVAGLVKVGADIALLVDPNNKTAQDISHWAGIVQMAVGFLSMGLDLANTVRTGYTAVVAAKATARAAKGVLSGVSVNITITISKDVAQKVSKSILDTVMQKIKDILCKKLFKGLISKILGDLSGKITEKAIEKAVQTGLEKGMEAALKEGLKMGSKALIKKVSDVAAKEVQKLVFEALKEVLGMNKWIEASRAIVAGMNAVVSGAYSGVAAEGTSRINQCQLKIKVLTYVIDNRTKSYEAASQAAELIVKNLEDTITGLLGAMQQRTLTLGQAFS